MPRFPKRLLAAMVLGVFVLSSAVRSPRAEEAANDHWSYVRPVRPAVPAVADTAWPRSPLDFFVLSRLEREGLRPAPAAAREILVRRVYLDLIGLPPSPAEVDEFLADPSPNAWERLIDRLLASSQFGVRWARPWLDCARYADSHGFQRDDFRDLWAYRDWVVDAFNADMPFDQFTVEQLAGDLLPNATLSQRIASGFNRNAPTNVEAGSDPEETRVNQVFDRVNTVGMAWLGSTMECCQCHDHKFDPFTIEDYYGLYAFFNNTEIEAERSNPKVPGSIRFLGPETVLDDPRIQSARGRLQQEMETAGRELAELERRAAAPDQAWEAAFLDAVNRAPQEHVLQIDDFDSLGGATHEVLADQSVLLSGEAPDRDTYTAVVLTSLRDIRAIKLEALTDPSLPGTGPGRGDAARPNFVLNHFSLTVALPHGAEPVAVPFARATADFSQKGFDVARAIDENAKTAWAINPKFHEPHWAIFELAEPIDGGQPATLTFKLEQNYGSGRTIGRLRLTAITGNYGGESFPASVVAAVRVPAVQRTMEQQKAIAAYRTTQMPEYVRCQKEKARLMAELEKLKLPTTLVMHELEKPRATAMFLRGDYRRPGRPIQPATPEILPPLSVSQSSSTPTRLDLAHWLVRDDNPLTARVVVNRWWAELFGEGLVTTPEDFGIQGEPPTHPELLDWLALEYIDNRWSLKQLLKTIVMSATYQQASRITPELIARDDRNLLYARGPRFRLDAEGIRDNALSVSGLISRNQGGPPVRPFQPDGIWTKVGGQRYEYVISNGEQQFRRGLYVVLKRGAPYPSFVNFDANNRMACRVQRTRSNTPLQALTLLNDPVYVDAARAMARRILEEMPQATLDEQLGYAFRLAVVRQPSPSELAVIRNLFEQQREASRLAPGDSGEFPDRVQRPSGVRPEEFAAWYAVAAALLNLDETITKG